MSGRRRRRFGVCEAVRGGGYNHFRSAPGAQKLGFEETYPPESGVDGLY